jgi:hypothetical protein
MLRLPEAKMADSDHPTGPDRDGRRARAAAEIITFVVCWLVARRALLDAGMVDPTASTSAVPIAVFVAGIVFRFMS